MKKIGPKHITQKEIASGLGVSTMTVSRVLAGKCGNKVSAELAEKIREKARESHYRKNGFAAAMRSGRSPLAALCLHRNFGSGRDFYQSELIAEYTEVLTVHQMEVLLIPYSTPADLQKRLSAMTEAGLISSIASNLLPGAEEAVVRLIVSFGLPHVFFGKTEKADVPCTWIEYSTSLTFLLEQLRPEGAESLEYFQCNFPLPDWKQVKNPGIFFQVPDLTTADFLAVRTGIAENRIHVVSNSAYDFGGGGGFLVQSYAKERCQAAFELLSAQMNGEKPQEPHRVFRLTEKDIVRIPSFDQKILRKEQTCFSTHLSSLISHT